MFSFNYISSLDLFSRFKKNSLNSYYPYKENCFKYSILN